MPAARKPTQVRTEEVVGVWKHDLRGLSRIERGPGLYRVVLGGKGNLSGKF